MLLGFAGQGFVYCGDVRELLPASALPHSSVAALCQSLCAPSGGSRLALVLPLLSRASLRVFPSVVWYYVILLHGLVCCVFQGGGKGRGL